MRRAVLAALLALSTSHAHAQAPSGSGTFRVTAFCLQGPMRSGEWTRWGAVATDPRVIPLYSTVDIAGTSRTFTALDTGGGVLGNHVDIYMPECGDALEWGSQYRTVEWSAP